MYRLIYIDTTRWTELYTLRRSQTCWSPAAAFVKPSTAEEVAQVLGIVSRTGSKFSIRSTGHNPNPGFNSINEGGIVIDLGNLNSKTLGGDGILLAGAGNTWGDIYPWLEDQKRSAMGGRETAVGLSGFLLGGKCTGCDHTKQVLIRRRRSWAITKPLWYRSR